MTDTSRKRGPRHIAGMLLVLVVAIIPASRDADAQGDSVVQTLHNLSVTGPGAIRSQTETEVCKFCHVPHNAEVPQPLWGHRLSASQYEVPEIRSAAGMKALAPQPDGSSRLCLSCHDGTVALGDVAGELQPIPMIGSQRLTGTHSGYIGTDLSGSHPVSFIVTRVDPGAQNGDVDMGIKPLAVIEADTSVHLDERGKMQCTTCHDPHKDQYYFPGRVPRFWVKATVEEVCLTCHELR